mgnify:FL=1
MLCVKNVSLRLPESRLLTNVNFTVDKGDIVTLMGPSGCGKSTLFSWMIGALAEQFSCTGELWLNEQRIDILPTAQRQIGILFQDALLFDQFSVGQNLLLALPATLKGNARRNAVNDALERSGLEGAFHQDPATLLAVSERALLYYAPFSPNQKRYSWMSHSAVLMWLCAIIFASGCSAKFAPWRSPSFR